MGRLVSVLDIVSFSKTTALSPGDLPLWTALLQFPCPPASGWIWPTRSPGSWWGKGGEWGRCIYSPGFLFVMLPWAFLLKVLSSQGTLLRVTVCFHVQKSTSPPVSSGLQVVTAPWLLFSSVLLSVVLLNLTHTLLNNAFINKSSLNYLNLNVKCLVSNWYLIHPVRPTQCQAMSGESITIIYEVNKWSLKLLLTVTVWFCDPTRQLHIMTWRGSQSHWRHTLTYPQTHTQIHAARLAEWIMSRFFLKVVDLCVGRFQGEWALQDKCSEKQSCSSNCFRSFLSGSFPSGC